METKNIDELKANPKNPRTLSEHDGKALATSMKEFGDLSCIVFNIRTNQLVGGHQRISVLTRLLSGEKKVVITQRFDVPDHEGTVALGYVSYDNRQFAYREVDWPEERELAANIAANRIQGEFQLDMLAQINYELSQLENGAELLGFTGQTEDEINKLLDMVGANGESGLADDEAPPVDDANPAVSRLGEIYQLGKHRLMCGDSTNGENVNLVLNGIMPILMITDPPYGVEYDPEWREGSDLGVGERSKGKVANDDRIDWTEAYELFGGDVAYVWHASYFTDIVKQNLESVGFKAITNIIWAKQHFALSRGDYHWQHEPCWYMVRNGKPHNWQGARDQTSIWEIKNNNSFGNSEAEETWGHGTQKPIECMARPMRNNSKRGDVVYDPFGGSGTTLIAADQLDRICYMIELEPKYCDVIRKRYAKHVGEVERWADVTPVIQSADETPTTPEQPAEPPVATA